MALHRPVGLRARLRAPSGRRPDPEDVNRHGILASAGVAGERAGLQIQRNATVISTQASQTLADRGVWFGSLDEAAATRPELVEPYLHSLVPADRTKFTALHAAFRTGGTFLHVPRDTAIQLPIQTLTYLDAEGAAVFPHTLVVVEAGSEVTFIDRYAGPRSHAGLQRRDHRDPRRRRRARALRRDPGVGERRDPPRDPAGHGRARRHPADPQHRLRRLPRSGRGRDDPRRARRVQRDARGLLRRRGPALRPPLDPGPRGAELHERPPLQGRAPRPLPRRLQRLGPRAARARRRRTRCRPRATSSCRSTRRPTRSRTSRSRRTT